MYSVSRLNTASRCCGLTATPPPSYQSARHRQDQPHPGTNLRTKYFAPLAEILVALSRAVGRKREWGGVRKAAFSLANRNSPSLGGRLTFREPRKLLSIRASLGDRFLFFL
jgi:hypothetical protein